MSVKPLTRNHTETRHARLSCSQASTSTASEVRSTALVSTIFVRSREVMNTLHWLALVLVIIGALNCGLVGLFQLDLVAALFGGQGSPLSSPR